MKCTWKHLTTVWRINNYWYMVLNTCTNAVCWEAIILAVQVLLLNQTLSAQLQGNVSNSFNVSVLFKTIISGCIFFLAPISGTSLLMFSIEREYYFKRIMDIFRELNTITVVSSHTKPTQTRLWCVCVKRVPIGEGWNRLDCHTALLVAHPSKQLSLSVNINVQQCTSNGASPELQIKM